MSPQQAEHTLLSASEVEACFLKSKEHILYHIPAVKRTHTPARSWRMLAFISGILLLSADNHAVVIWDTSMHALRSSTIVPTPLARFTLSNFLCHVHDNSTLYIAVSLTHANFQSVVIYSVSLSSLGTNEENHHGHLHHEAEFPLRERDQLKYMDPYSGRALLHCSSSSIQILHWRDDNRRSTIPIEQDALDEWNGITSLRFCGPYILCFRVRSVEAYPIPDNTSIVHPLPVLRYWFGPVSFRVMSLSHVRASRCPSGEVYSIFMLTNDVYQGMFHYRIRVAVSPVPSMSVHILAKGGIHMASDSLPSMPGTDIRYTQEDIIRQMFVATWSLGSAGLRGVWVDRQRGSIDRRVVAFTTRPPRLRTKGAHENTPDVTPENIDEVPSVEGNVVHVNSSYDLRDDITICAVSEWTGRIALGSRVGAISLL